MLPHESCSQDSALSTLQERACQLVAVLATYTPSRAAVLEGCVQPLLELCNAAVSAPVMTQACYALRELTRPTGSCNAGSQLLSLDAAKVLLELLKSKQVMLSSCGLAVYCNKSCMACCHGLLQAQVCHL